VQISESAEGTLQYFSL